MKKYRKYIISVAVIILLLMAVCFIPISVSKLIPVIEKQITQDYGVQVHIEKLVMRLGPELKLKTPLIHVMYEDGQKFAQLDSVKLYIPWASVIKNKPYARSLSAERLIIRTGSEDKYLYDVLKKINDNDFSRLPDLYLKNCKISYLDKQTSNNYDIVSQNTELKKVPLFKNFKISTAGDFYINDKQYINFDVTVLPKFNLEPDLNKQFNIDNLSQIKDLDFHSDIVTDLKLFMNKEGILQSSGYLNIDNISVLDKAEKSQKSFIYLTFLGDKAGILSNIYTTGNKKIYIDGTIKNSKKPVLDLKVKTDEMDLNDTYQKLQLFAKMSYFKNIKSVTGKLNANFTIKGDLSKIKSSGYMKISNAGINADGVKIDNINSDIDFSNNVINVNNAIGYVNKAPILVKGKVDKELNLELLMSKVELKNLIPEKFGVKNGIISLAAKIGGTFDNISHKETLLVENFAANNKDNNISIESIRYDTTKNNSAYINNVQINTAETALIKIPSLKILVEKNVLNIPDFNIFMPNSRLTAKGIISNYSNNDIAYNSKISGYINSSDIKAIKTYSTIYPVKALIYGNKTVQNILSQVLFEKSTIFDEPTVLNLVSKFDKNTLKLDDISIHAFSGKFSDDLKLNTKGQKKLTANGIVEFAEIPVLKNLRINTPQQLNINLPDSRLQLKGDLFINGKYNQPEIIGQVQIQNFYNQPLELSLLNCTADFNKNVVSINAPLVKLSDSSMGITGTISTDISNSISIRNLNIKSKSLNTDTLLMYKDNPLVTMYPVTIQDGKFYSERILANIYGSPLYLTAFSGDLSLKNNVLELKNIASEIFNGKMSGILKFNMKDETFNSSIMARGVSASPIFNIISARKETISGVMDFDFNLTGNITSKQSLNGDIKFIAKNGRMSTLGKLEHLLYAQNIIADNMLRTSLSIVTKAITLKDTGLFKYLKGDIKMSNGCANIKFLQSQGPLMALFMKGQYYPETDYAKLTILGRLSDEVISGLGAFGDFSMKKLMVMLTGEDNKYNITTEDIENLPQLPVRNTKEFKSTINGIIDKPSSVQTFNWISYSEKSLRQKEVPMGNVKVPDFVENLPY